MQGSVLSTIMCLVPHDPLVCFAVANALMVATTGAICRRRVKEAHLKRKGPLLTHCSAGVGRTGTFIGLDRFLDNCLVCKSVPVLEIVQDMRHYRNFMVQSPVCSSIRGPATPLPKSRRGVLLLVLDGFQLLDNPAVF